MTESNQIEYGWFLPTAGDAEDKLGSREHRIPASIEHFEKVTLAAENAGFSYLLIPTAGDCWEAWVAGSMMAALTTKIKMLVALRPGYIKPAQLGKMIGTLDQLSNGRVLINLIAGASSAETAREGVNVPKEQRYEMMREEVEILKSVWTSKEPISYAGKHHTVTDLKLRPRVQQKPYPAFYLGGASADALEVSAQHSSVHLFWGDTTESITQQIAHIRQLSEKYQRDEPIRFGMRFQVVCRETEQEAWDAANGLIEDVVNQEGANQARENLFEDSTADRKMKEFSQADSLHIAPHLWAGITKVRQGAGVAVVGNPQQVADTIQKYIDIGCTSFCLSGYRHDKEAERFGQLVMPLLDAANS